MGAGCRYICFHSGGSSQARGRSNVGTESNSNHRFIPLSYPPHVKYPPLCPCDCFSSPTPAHATSQSMLPTTPTYPSPCHPTPPPPSPIDQSQRHKRLARPPSTHIQPKTGLHRPRQAGSSDAPSCLSRVISCPWFPLHRRC